MSATARQDGSGIDIRLPSGKSTVLRLRSSGIRTKTDCEFIATKVRQLIAAINMGTSPSPDLQNWLHALPDKIYDKLHALGLVPRRLGNPEFSTYLDEFIQTHSAGKTLGTLKVLKRAQRHATQFFSHMRVREIDVRSAKEFRRWLQKLPGKQGAAMAEATIRKTCGVVKQCLDQAHAEGLITLNPITAAKVPISAGRNPLREAYVSTETIEKVLLHLGDSEEALLFALSRFGALRVPSEIRDLRWIDVDWDRRELRVRSPKTASTGKNSRVVPIFPRLFNALQIAYANRNSSVEFLLPTLRIHTNLNVPLRRAVTAAGVAEYPKVTHNLRASCITDWVRAGHPIPDVAEWSGHSPKVLLDHYIRKANNNHASAAALAAAKTDGDTDGKADAELTAPRGFSTSQAKSRESQAVASEGTYDRHDHRRHFVTTGDRTSRTDSVDLIGLEPTTSSMPWKRSPK